VLCALLTTNRVHAEAAPAESAKQQADALFASDFSIDERDPERNIPGEAERNAKPVDFGNYLMALSGKAEDAQKQGDQLSAAKYFRALAKAVPDRSIAFAKLCGAYEAAGQRDKAEQSCGDALSRSGVTVADFVHYVRVVLAQAAPLSKTQVTRVDAAIAHLATEAGTLTVSAELACDLAVRLNDGKRLARCTSELRKRAPNDLKTISYDWAFALRRGDLSVAEHLVERAKQLGMRPQGISRMEEATRAAAPSTLRMLRERPISILLAATGLAGLVMLVLSLLMRKRRSLRQVVSKFR
jgi:hypothetical protein